MTRRTIAAAATAAALWAMLLPAPAHAAALAGRVVMRTAGAPLPEGLQVTAVEISASGEMSGPRHVPVAADGSYSFEGDPSLSHLVGTIYKDVTYSMIVEPGELPSRELEVHETTNDVAVVKVQSDTLTVIPSSGDQPDVLEVLQVMRFRNDSDRSYIGDGEGNGVLKLPVPESAFDLASAEENNPSGIATTQRGLATSTGLAPGETSISYLYKVRVPRTGWQLQRETYYPTGNSDLLVGEGLDLAAAPGFDFQENVDLGGKSYRRYRSAARAPGEVLGADMAFAGGGDGESGVWYGAGAILAAVAALGIAGAVAVRKRRQGKTSPAGATERDELIDQVARLDESYDAGGIDRSEYEARRSSLLAKLRAASSLTES